MREQNNEQQAWVLREMCSMMVQILRSPPLPNPFHFSSSFFYRTESPISSSPSAFASLFLVISVALMMLGSVAFVIGFVLMPCVVGLVLLFCFVAAVSDLLELGRYIICPNSSPKDLTGENLAIRRKDANFPELRRVVETSTDRGASPGLGRDIGITEFILLARKGKGYHCVFGKSVY